MTDHSNVAPARKCSPRRGRWYDMSGYIQVGVRDVAGIVGNGFCSAGWLGGFTLQDHLFYFIKLIRCFNYILRMNSMFFPSKTPCRWFLFNKTLCRCFLLKKISYKVTNPSFQVVEEG